MSTPPPAAIRPNAAEHHGIVRQDPYFWMRDVESPEVLEQLGAENAYSDEFFEELQPSIDELYRKIRSHICETDLSVPVDKGDWRYLTRTTEGEQYATHCRRRLTDGVEGPEQVYFDENEAALGGDYFDLGLFEVSPDGSQLAWSVDRDGSERFELWVRDLDSGQDRMVGPTEIGAGGTWTSDGAGLLVIRLDGAHRPFQIWLVSLETGAETLLLQEDDEQFIVAVTRERDESFLQFSSVAARTNEVWVVPADRPLDPPRSLTGRTDGIESWVCHRSDRFYYVTNDGAKTFECRSGPDGLAMVDCDEVVVPAADDTQLLGFDAFAHFGALFRRTGGTVGVELLNWDDHQLRPLPSDEELATMWPGSNPEFDTSFFRYGYSSLVTPTTVYRIPVNVADAKPTLLKQQPVPGYDPQHYRSRRVWAAAEDGTKVPVSLLWRGDDELPQGRKCVMTVYGSYEVAIDPSFSPTRLPLLDDGYLLAIAHPRGGGELGRSWYTDALFANKPRTFSDTVACVAHLAELGVTAPGGVVLRGGSAGGLTVGAVMNARPDLLAGVVAEVPFVDVLNTMLDPTLPLTVGEYPEWGDPGSDPAIYDAIAGYSPYENVAPLSYPPLYATAGLSDPRVAVWEPLKWVSKLRDVAPDGGPYVLRVEMGAGHGGPTGRYDAWRDEARTQAFCRWSLQHKHQPC